MVTPEHCLLKAEECELRAAESEGEQRAEWLLMAAEWRESAIAARLTPAMPEAERQTNETEPVHFDKLADLTRKLECSEDEARFEDGDEGR